MTKKNIFLLILGSFLFIFGIYCYLKITKKATINMEAATTSYNLHTDDLIANFIADEKGTDEKFEGKIIKIEGKVKEVSFLNNTNTIILFGDKNSGIICDFGKNQTKEIKALTKNQTITIKGIYKGFLKDVILLNCLLMNDKTNE
jgi:exoribonuclease II